MPSFKLSYVALFAFCILAGCGAPIEETEDPIGETITLRQELRDIQCACPMGHGFADEESCMESETTAPLTASQEGCARDFVEDHGGESAPVIACFNQANRDLVDCLSADSDCPPNANLVTGCQEVFRDEAAACPAFSSEHQAEFQACFQ